MPAPLANMCTGGMTTGFTTVGIDFLHCSWHSIWMEFIYPYIYIFTILTGYSDPTMEWSERTEGYPNIL